MTKIYTGYVYVMDGETGEIKIGVSREPAKRLLQVRSNVGHPLELIAAWAHPQPYMVEREAHSDLAEFRTTGEWFAIGVYTAFEAVCRAIQAVDAALSKRQAQPMLPLDVPDIAQPIAALPAVEETISEAVLSLVPDLPASAYLLGYAAPTSSAPAGLQVEWLVASGMKRSEIYIEQMLGATERRDLMLKDCRDGDILLAWSPEVFATEAADVARWVAEKGGRIVYANQTEGVYS